MEQRAEDKVMLSAFPFGQLKTAFDEEAVWKQTVRFGSLTASAP